MVLPPRPSSICSACWKGAFAAHLGLLGEPIEFVWDQDTHRLADDCTGGYAYTISPAKLLFRAAFGCKWCAFLVEHFRNANNQLERPEDRWWPTRRTLCIRIGCMEEEWILRIVVDGIEVEYGGYAVSTSPGAFYTAGTPSECT